MTHTSVDENLVGKIFAFRGQKQELYRYGQRQRQSTG